MSKVTLWPSGKIIEVDSDKCLLDLLQSAEIVIQSECGGHANCGKCVIKVHTGESHLSPPEFKELKLLGNVFHLTKERLSCQTNVTGDVTIDISSQTDGKSAHKKKNAHEKNHKTHLKKGQQVKVEAMELSKRQTADEETAKQKHEEWFRHWEKRSGTEGDDHRPKRLDGNKRPRMFKTPDADSDKIKKD